MFFGAFKVKKMPPRPVKTYISFQDDQSNESGPSLFSNETPALSDEVPFEMMVLDNALDATTKKFNRHLKRFLIS